MLAALAVGDPVVSLRELTHGQCGHRRDECGQVVLLRDRHAIEYKGTLCSYSRRTVWRLHGPPQCTASTMRACTCCPASSGWMIASAISSFAWCASAAHVVRFSRKLSIA